jgi:hypothetical protein
MYVDLEMYVRGWWLIYVCVTSAARCTLHRSNFCRLTFCVAENICDVVAVLQRSINPVNEVYCDCLSHGFVLRIWLRKHLAIRFRIDRANELVEARCWGPPNSAWVHWAPWPAIMSRHVQHAGSATVKMQRNSDIGLTHAGLTYITWAITLLSIELIVCITLS